MPGIWPKISNGRASPATRLMAWPVRFAIEAPRIWPQSMICVSWSFALEARLSQIELKIADAQTAMIK